MAINIQKIYDATWEHYQKAKNFEEAFEEIRKCRGTQFDPDIAEKFVDAIESAYN